MAPEQLLLLKGRVRQKGVLMSQVHANLVERFWLMLEIRRDQACSWWAAWRFAGVTLRDYQEYARRWDADLS